jgi:hypothetical protein
MAEDSFLKKASRFLLGEGMAAQAADKTNLRVQYDKEKSDKEESGEEMEPIDKWMSKHDFHSHPGD